jgi:ABC-type transport system substrate-binding protein
VVLAALLAACTPGAAEPPGPGFAREAARDVLRIGLVDAVALDPVEINPASPSQVLVADLLFDGLTTFDAAGGAVVPALARSWTVSPDGLVWTFAIDPEARFADGRPVTAGAAKATIDRVVGLGVASLSGSSLAMVRSVEAPDAATLEVRLSGPFSALPEVLADPVLGITPEEGVRGSLPVGSGSYAIERRDGSTAALRRVPGAPAGVEAIELRWYADAAAAYAAFRAGEVDLAALAPEHVDEASGSGDTVLSASQRVSLFYGMNLAAPALRSPEMRQAIVKAVDREAIARRLFGHAAEAMTGLIGPGAAARRDDACGAACAHDPGAARALIAAAYPAGGVPAVHVDHYSEPSGREAAVAEAIVTALRDVGIPAEARAHAFEDYRRVPTSDGAELFRFGWVGTNPSAEADLGSLFSTNGSDNVFRLADAEIDAHLAEARAARDPATRAGHYAAAEDRILAIVPVVPVVQYRVHMVVSPRLTGAHLSPNGSIDVTRLSLTAR